MFIFVIAAAVASQCRGEDHDEVSLLQLRNKHRVNERSEPDASVELWPQHGPNYRKCADPTGHRIDPEVSACGSNMIDIVIENKTVEGYYYQEKGKGAAYLGPSGLNLRYKNVATYDGMDLDLKVVNVNDDYEPGHKRVMQGLFGAPFESGGGDSKKLGVVSVRSNTATGFKFSLVKHGTDVEIPVPELPVTMYDIDGSGGCAMRETVFASGYTYMKIGAHLTNITGGFRNGFPPEAGESASITSPASSSEDDLTEDQKSVSAGYVFANTASFTVTFDASHGFSYEDMDAEPDPIHACKTNLHARWMLFSLQKLPCEGNYLTETVPDAHPLPVVESQEACQKLAEDVSHPYYSFEPNTKRCFTSAKCFEPVDTTDDDEPWKIHIDLWPKHNNSHIACAPVDGAPTVHSELKCQELAIERGHRFYSFLETTKACVTSYDCGTPDHEPPFLDDPWRIREEPWWQWGSSNRKCDTVGQEKPAPSQWACQRRAWSLRDGFYSWQPHTKMCKTSRICENPVPTDPEDDWRIHIDRWPINGDPGDGLCGDGTQYLEGIGKGDGADCQTLCGVNDDCKHYCYLDSGAEGNCRTFSGKCGAEGKTGGTTDDNSYTCYDKPPPPPTTTTTTTGGVTTIPEWSPNPTTSTPTTTEDEQFIEFEYPEPAPATTTPEPAPITTTSTTSSTEEEEFIEQEPSPEPSPQPAPEPGVIEDCCGHDVEENAISGTCYSMITDLPLDSLHDRDAFETFDDNVLLTHFKYYLEHCTFGDECSYTELTDPDPRHHKFKVGKSRVKIVAYDLSGNTYACMRNVYIHDMQPPTFVYGDPVYNTETGETYRQQFNPDSLTVRLEVDKTTCNKRVTDIFSAYETLQGVSGHDLEAQDNCDVIRDDDEIGAEVVKKIYDSDDNLLYDSSSQEFDAQTQITTGPGHYKMEIIGIDDYSDGIKFPSNRSENMHKSTIHLELELHDEEPPRDVSACPADMTGDREVLIDPSETETTVSWDVPNVTFDNCQHHEPPPAPTCVVDQLVDGVDRQSGQYGETCHPGMTLHVGVHLVVYSFTDGYGNPPGGLECEFRIHIVQREHPVTLTCPDDITLTTMPMREFAIVTWDDPVAMQGGKALPKSHISYPQGVASGMPFPFGVTEIKVRAEGHDYAAVQQGNQVQQWDECMFNVTVLDEENPKCDGREFRCNASSAAVYPPLIKPYSICDGPELQVELREGYPTSFGYYTIGVGEASGSCCDSEMDVPHVCTAIPGTGTSYCAPSS